MATQGSELNMSEETFEHICTSCAEDDLIKPALKYCVECQRYCCQDCLTFHRRIPSLREHSFMDNSSAKPQGQRSSLPSFPTQQCSKHAGMIMYMYCKNHDVVCCYVCAAEDHRSCDDMVSVSDNIDQLYSKTDTSNTASDIDRVLNEMNNRHNNSDARLQKLGDSKQAAIKAATDFRLEMEQLLNELEKASINDIENEYKKLKTQLLEERKRYEESINRLKNLKQILVKASGNIAQQFVCSKLAQQNMKTMETRETASSNVCHAEVIFRPLEDLKTSLERMASLGITSTMSSKTNHLYKVEKVHDMNIKLQDDSKSCRILGSLIVDDTVLLTDANNKKLKRFDILSSSLKDYCTLPDSPRGLCKVGQNEVAVACSKTVQFISINDTLTLGRSIKMKHNSYGIGYNDDKLYITDANKSLYMYDISGTLLKTVTAGSNGESLFQCSNHITFSEKNSILFVGDKYKGLVCFNSQCDYIETITDADVRPDGVCVDGYGDVIVANYGQNTIVQCGQDGQKRGVIVNKDGCPHHPRCVCIHPRLNRLFVGSTSNVVRVYHLC